MYRFEYKAYRRPLAGSFANARETFKSRDGILVRLEDSDGRVGYGEAAPLSSFGTESFPSAIAAAAELGSSLEPEQVASLLRSVPALNWAIETALDAIAREGRWPEVETPWPVCGLVGNLLDLRAVEERLSMHYRCLKFKIGKLSVGEERRALDRVVDLAGPEVAIRLDANGGLKRREAQAWLEAAAELPVEFVEQPLPKGSEQEMLRLGQDFPTPIALDESVASVDDLKRYRDEQWPGIFVLKPSLSGGLAALRAELENGPCDCVFSSALETKVGAAHAVACALRYPNRRRPLGFGVEALFADGNVGFEPGPFLQRDALPDSDECERLWNRI